MSEQVIICIDLEGFFFIVNLERTMCLETHGKLRLLRLLQCGQLDYKQKKARVCTSFGIGFVENRSSRSKRCLCV